MITEERKAQLHKYYQDHKDDILAKQREYNEEHKEQQSLKRHERHLRNRNQDNERQREYYKTYYAKNKEELIKKAVAYHSKHKDKSCAASAKFREINNEAWRQIKQRYNSTHREEARQYSARYWREHPEVVRNWNRMRKARAKGAEGRFTQQEFERKCGVYNGRCVYCGTISELFPDHATPLSRGGRNDINNILPACADCNMEKHNKTYSEYLFRKLVDCGADRVLMESV